MPTIDEIKAAAEVLDALFDEDAEREIAYESTYFGYTAKQLRELAELATDAVYTDGPDVQEWFAHGQAPDRFWPKEERA